MGFLAYFWGPPTNLYNVLNNYNRAKSPPKTDTDPNPGPSLAGCASGRHQHQGPEEPADHGQNHTASLRRPDRQAAGAGGGGRGRGGWVHTRDRIRSQPDPRHLIRPRAAAAGGLSSEPAGPAAAATAAAVLPVLLGRRHVPRGLGDAGGDAVCNAGGGGGAGGGDGEAARLCR